MILAQCIWLHIPWIIHYALQPLFINEILKLENDLKKTMDTKLSLEWEHFHALHPNKVSQGSITSIKEMLFNSGSAHVFVSYKCHPLCKKRCFIDI